MSASLAVGIAVGSMVAASSAPSGPMPPEVARIMGGAILFLFLAAGVGVWRFWYNDRVEGAMVGALIGLILLLFAAGVGMVLA